MQERGARSYDIFEEEPALLESRRVKSVVSVARLPTDHMFIV